MTHREEWPPAAELRSGEQCLSVRRLGAGPRLVLLHGGPGLDHHMMLPLAEPLAERFRVWLPDLPGHGRSPSSGRGLPDLNVLVESTARFLERLDPAPAVLVGHSLGAWMVRELLRSRRLAPRAAVLVSMPAIDPTSGNAVRGAVRRVRSGRGNRRSLLAEILEFCAAGDRQPPSHAFVDALGRSRLERPDAYRVLQGQLRRNLSQPVRACPASCPVLFLTGDADAVGTPESLEPVVRATDGAELRVLEGTGHVPFVSDVRPCADAILSFVMRHV